MFKIFRRKPIPTTHTLAITDSHGNLLCEIDFAAEEWEDIQQIALNLFLKRAIQTFVNGQGKQKMDELHTLVNATINGGDVNTLDRWLKRNADLVDPLLEEFIAPAQLVLAEYFSGERTTSSMRIALRNLAKKLDPWTEWLDLGNPSDG